MENFLEKLAPTIFVKLLEHLQLTFIASFLAILIAVPFGILLTRLKSESISNLILRILSTVQTIPGLALMAMIIVFLAFIRPIASLPTTGFFPAVLVLVIYSFLPILSNTYTGIKQVNPSMVEVARAMGMRESQILFWVEVPLSLPVLITGIRVSIVWTISLVTLTSLIGSGGLGDLIVQGLRTMQMDLVLAGTIPAAVLAIIFDFCIAKAGKWLAPIENLRRI
ncbi:MAG: hypothetical protein Tsb0015_05170 [Simkaniaceae bacterium]